MKRVLFISAFHPSGIGSIGAGEAICGNNLKEFLAQSYEVDVIVCTPSDQRRNEELATRCASYVEEHTSKIKQISGILFNFFKGSIFAPWFYTRITPFLIKIIQHKLDQNDYDIVWLDFPSVLGCVDHIKHNNIHYFAHDVVSQRISRTKINKIFFPWVGTIESGLLNKLTGIRTMSNKDKDLIRTLGFNGAVSVVELGQQRVGQVDNGTEISKIVSSFAGKTNLVFFGNMKRSENHWSILWFIFFHFIKMKKEKRNLNLWVLGIQPRQSLKILEKLITGVHVVGAVDDPVPAFIRADLNIAPLLYGAGVKIKVLQILDAGAKVVATEIGAEGIQHHENLFIVNKADISKKILTLLE